MKIANTLKENQKQKTLAGKKRKFKPKDKPVLANVPPEISFVGYELKEEDCIEFEILMANYYTYTPRDVRKWSELKYLSKEERKKLRGKVEIPSRKYLALGYNEVSRSLQNKTALLVIMSGDITPNTLNKHIYRCCDIYGIPLIKVANLKQISKICFGFSSMAMAFIKDVPSDERIYDLYNYLDKRFIIPFHKDRKRESIPLEVNKKVKNLSLQTKNEKSTTLDLKNDKFTPEPKSKSNIYLKRNTTDQRIFIPNSKSHDFGSDFIPFDDTSMITNISDDDNDDKGVIVPFPDTCQERQIIRRMKIKKIAANEERKLQGKK